MLDANLAQQIVDRTMSIIGYNINVMNHAASSSAVATADVSAMCTTAPFWR